MSKILIVEDNAESRYMLERLLTSKGHRIITAENGEDALRLARQDPPEVIISDIMMPVMNGFRFCREVKNDPGLRNIPFIFYTATFVEKADKKLAMSLGASRFVVKPTEGERFIQILDEVLDEYRQGSLPVPERPLEGENILLEMYDNSVARKLSETVEKLQDERKALIESEQRLKEAQELAHIGHWELDLKTNSLKCSDEIYRIVGLKPKKFDASYEAFMDFVHPDDKAYVTTAHEESLAKKIQCDIECRVLLKDGTIKYVNERFQTIYDDYGMPACLMGTVQDITERKRSETVLRESEKKYRSVVENSLDVIFTLSTDGTFSSLSPAFETITGFSRAKSLGKSFAPIIHPDDLPLAMEILQSVLQGETPPIFELRVLSKSGEYIVGQFTATPQIQKGKVFSVLGIARDITKLKKTNEDLRKSEERYRAMFNNIMNGVAVYRTGNNGKDFIFVDFNKSAERMENIRKEDLIGKSVLKVFPGVKDFGLFDVFQRVWKTGKPESHPITQYKDERILGWRENFVYKLPSGEIVSVYSDETKRKQAEEALREAESMYRLHFENVSDVIYSIDRELKIVSISPSVEHLLGYKPEELIGRPFQELNLLAPEYLEQAASDTMRVLRGERISSAEYQFIARDGTKKWGGVSGAPLIRDGQVGAVISVARDITERKRTEEALRQSEYQLSIRNRINEIFLTISGEEMYGEILKIVLEIMESKYGIFGYINEDDAWVCPSMTRDIWDECRIPDKAIIFAKDQWGGIWGRAMNEKKTLYSNKVLTVPEGHIPITRALDVPIIYQGALIGNLLVGNKETNYGEKDIQVLENIADKIAPVLHSTLQIEKQGREKKQLEAQLAQSQKMEAIGTLAGGVAHDFNNILTAIIGNAELILMDLGKEHPLREEIKEIKKAGERAASLTRQLLAFSRKQVMKPEVLDLNEVITETEKMLKRLIGEDVELSMVLEPEPWKVHADRGQVEQVIMNLTVNARDAMPQGGRLTVETANIDLEEDYFRKHGIEEQPGSYVMLSVSDTGIGMDKETQSHIFEPFFTSKGIGKGTGLGLSTVYGVVKQNNGFIWVYSEPGQGCTFKIYLPRVKGDVKGEKKERTPIIKLDGSETVLIVEDDDSLRKLAQKSLQPHGYRVLVAENGEDALRISKEHEGPIDLLITDVVMPKMGGKEVAERLQPLYPRMKAIYMSGYTDGTIVNHGVLAPGLNFLEKPFSPKGLARKVRKVLNKQIDD
jgi:PAS domain S-box-containing protein